jgi:hypothetical protein
VIVAAFSGNKPRSEADGDSCARIEVVAERVAEEVEGKNAEHDGYGREDDEVGCVKKERSRVVEHGAPAGGGWRHAEAEEAERSFGEHGSGHADGGLDYEGLQDIGKDVAGEDAQIAGADGAGGFDELALAHGEDLGANETGVADPAADGEGEDEVEEPGAEEGNEGDGEKNTGQRQEGIHQEGIDGDVDPASVIAGDAAEDEAEEERKADNGDSDGEGEACSPDDAGEDVAAEFVGAEPVRAGGRSEPVGEIESGRVIRCEQGGKERHQDESAHEYDANCCQGLAAE